MSLRILASFTIAATFFTCLASAQESLPSDRTASSSVPLISSPSSIPYKRVADSCEWNGNEHSVGACGQSVTDTCGVVHDCGAYTPWRRPVCDENGHCICAQKTGADAC